jgi:paraquat-inducible protein B
MAKQTNRMMIGGFVLIALFIMAASLVIFGSGKFFQKTKKFVMYFEGSVMGLNVGAPVLWQGVQIGSVVSIDLVADMTQAKMQIPVVVEILPARIDVVRGERASKKSLQRLIDQGLRAVLVTQSFITGQLAIEVGFYPDNGEPVFRKKLASAYEEYPEIPTIPSTAQRLMQALSRLDLEKIEGKFTASMDGIAKFVNDPNLAPSVLALRETLQSTHKFITRVDGKVDPLTKNVNKTVKDYRRLADNLNARVTELTASLDRTLSGLDKTLSGLDKTMTGVHGVVSPNAPLVVELESSLQQISAMSRSIRELADYLEMHPESLIRGKKKSGGKVSCN